MREGDGGGGWGARVGKRRGAGFGREGGRPTHPPARNLLTGRACSDGGGGPGPALAHAPHYRLYTRARQKVPSPSTPMPSPHTHAPSKPLFFSSSQVAKQDKKKTPKGRAKKRLQYNRRFVNVVTGPGKKRGPNSNPTQ